MFCAQDYTHACRFSTLLPFSSSSESLLLSEEFVEYQLLNNTDVPQAVWDQAKVYEEDGTDHYHYRMDIIWNFLSEMKSGDGCKKFGRLSKVAKLILVIPHSNAEEESFFYDPEK